MHGQANIKFSNSVAVIEIQIEETSEVKWNRIQSLSQTTIDNFADYFE